MNSKITLFIGIFFLIAGIVLKKTTDLFVVAIALMVIAVWFLNSVLKYDIDPKDARFESHFLSIIAFPANIKWLLVGIVFFSLAIFNLVFSSFSFSKSDFEWVSLYNWKSKLSKYLINFYTRIFYNLNKSFVNPIVFFQYLF